ncbi:MAG: DNA polymerase III subunit delta [bacterium]|nr:DNA polymerase III subunit delta [bacterium]
MQTINKHIKENEFKPVYLIYGTEDYLKKQYKGKLKAAVLGDSDDMNYSYFEGKDADPVKITDAINTLPFFNDKRVVIVENSGLFKSANTLADHLKEMPDSTVLVFVEKEIDKRNKLYKAVKDLGYISEMNGVDESSLKKWVAGKLKVENKKITGSTLDHFLAKTGGDMELINAELEKLVCYAMDKEIITTEDVDQVVVTQVSSQIFLMIDAIASKKQQTALQLYYDLIALKERPTSILYLITRHFNILLQVKDLYRLHESNATIAKRVGIPPFAVNKYVAQGRNFKRSILLEAVATATDIEEQIKTGRLNENMGVEMLIVKYSSTN